MGSLALRPGGSLAILLDGFVNRLQDSQFPSFLLFKLRGLDSYPGGTCTHCSCQPSLDAPFSVTDPASWAEHKPIRSMGMPAISHAAPNVARGAVAPVY
jgi:hypothetical protein